LRPVENFLGPHAACPRAEMCQSFRKRACLIFGTRTIVWANHAISSVAKIQKSTIWFSLVRARFESVVKTGPEWLVVISRGRHRISDQLALVRPVHWRQGWATG